MPFRIVPPPLPLAAGALALLPAIASAQSLGGYGDYLAWESWARIVPGERARLASSYDRSGGNSDVNHYEFPPGLILDDRDVTAATIAGPGLVARFWMPHKTANEAFAVRMFFDGESTPRLDSDSDSILDGVFGYFGDPLVTTFAGGQVCYEPIPFADSLRIDTENRAGVGHFYQYTIRTFPPGTPLASYTGALDPARQTARAAVVAMFENVGEHPGGDSPTSVTVPAGPALVPAGGAVTLADLTGPGLIRRLNVLMDGASDADLDSLRLRVFYDGDAEPAIDTPVGWFFGAGHGREPYRSLPIGTDSPDGFYCYWPMPFRFAARVELHNTSAAPIGVDSLVVEHEPGPVADDAGYLHTEARVTFVETGQTRNVMAAIEGTGHYVGNFLFVEQDHDTHFFLEGDDILVVDGADTLNGTGLEDAYNGGFYYNWGGNDPIEDEPEGAFPPFAFRPLCGILRVERNASPEFGRADQYRWQIADRIPFSQSLEVSVETQYSWAQSQWISVVFWYELPPTVTGAPEAAEHPRATRLALQCIPNPSGAVRAIRFVLPAPERRVLLEVIDLGGRRIETLLDGPRAAGTHEIRWNAGALADGVYFLRLVAADARATRKVVLRD